MTYLAAATRVILLSVACFEFVGIVCILLCNHQVVYPYSATTRSLKPMLSFAISQDLVGVITSPSYLLSDVKWAILGGNYHIH